MPALERLVDVPDPQIHTGIDFDAPQTRAEGELGLSIRLGTLIAVGLTLGLPALKWLRSYCKRHGPRQTAPRAAEQSGRVTRKEGIPWTRQRTRWRRRDL